MGRDYSNEPWWNAFTRAEREELARHLDGLSDEELEKQKESQRKDEENKKYRALFGCD